MVHSPRDILHFINRYLPRLLFYRQDAAKHAPSLLTRCHLREVWCTKLDILLDEGHFRWEVILQYVDKLPRDRPKLLREV